MDKDTRMHNTITYILRRNNRNRLCDDFLRDILGKLCKK